MSPIAGLRVVYGADRAVCVKNLVPVGKDASFVIVAYGFGVQCRGDRGKRVPHSEGREDMIPQIGEIILF